MMGQEARLRPYCQRAIVNGAQNEILVLFTDRLIQNRPHFDPDGIFTCFPERIICICKGPFYSADANDRDLGSFSSPRNLFRLLKGCEG